MRLLGCPTVARRPDSEAIGLWLLRAKDGGVAKREGIDMLR
jgi:hypothetical protein